MPTIICLSGCFDGLHLGHFKLLKRASKLATEGIIVICVNTDESIQRLKGKDRPKNNLAKRMNDLRWALEDFRQVYKIYPKIEKFSTEKELLSIYDKYEPDIIMHGNDITDITKVTGYPKWPILIVPRGVDINGNDISTTKFIQESINEQTKSSKG